MLYFNELSFRALLTHLDGVTDGPKSFSGHIGKQLKKCETMPIQEFEPVECTLPDVDEEDLSSIQKYLLKVVLAIKTGECSFDSSNSEPGTLNHAR